MRQFVRSSVIQKETFGKQVVEGDGGSYVKLKVFVLELQK